MGAFGLCWLYVLYCYSEQFFLSLSLLCFIYLVWQHHLAHHIWRLSPHRIQHILSRGDEWQLTSAHEVFHQARLLPTSTVVADIIILHFMAKTQKRFYIYVAPDNVPLSIYKQLIVRVKFLRLIPEQSIEPSHG